jgi:hypothetical protein
MECCWAGLLKKVEVAEDLDQVIDAHDSFLEQITTQCLLDPESQVCTIQSKSHSYRPFLAMVFIFYMARLFIRLLSFKVGSQYNARSCVVLISRDVNIYSLIF